MVVIFVRAWKTVSDCGDDVVGGHNKFAICYMWLVFRTQIAQRTVGKIPWNSP